MKKNFIAALSAFIITASSLFGQQRETFVTYTVSKGETVSKIAREYNIPVSEILKFNPEAKSGLRVGDILLIPERSPRESNVVTNPVKTKEATIDSDVSYVQKSIDKSENIVSKNNENTDQKNITHKVLKGETLYSISKDHQVNIEDLLFWNPDLKLTGLQSGSVIIIGNNAVLGQDNLQDKFPEKLSASQADTIVDINNIYYKYIQVEPQSTLYGLAVLYQTSIQRLVELNPELKQGLKTGQKIKVPAYGSGSSESLSTKKEQHVESPGFIQVKVAPKQTLYSLGRQYNVSVADIIKWNPQIQQLGLQIGMLLDIKVDNPSDYELIESIDKQTVVSDGVFVNLEKTLDKTQQKEIAFLLPFNLNNLGDQVELKLQNDSFLNMTLDFYSGAKMAVSKAQEMGLNLKARVYDSQEGKNSSEVVNIFKQNNFSNTDAIIGPFFQTNVETAANNLPNGNVILVSPLSNEKATLSRQVIQTMPSSDILKSSLLDYFLNQPSVKLTVVVDDRRTSTKNFMRTNYPMVKTIGVASIADLDKTLVSGMKNVFILDSGSIESASLFTKVLHKAVDRFDIQIASFDKADVFEYNEITVQALVDLKYSYASVTRDTPSSLVDPEFWETYKEIYKTSANRYAVRGFDVTMDIILRLFQQEGFENTLLYPSSELENQFRYVDQPLGGAKNIGVYILQYDSDFTVKMIN
ncbi:LysM peptidoglycan-binding domain-containing protein [Myroides sp. LJL119]